MPHPERLPKAASGCFKKSNNPSIFDFPPPDLGGMIGIRKESKQRLFPSLLSYVTSLSAFRSQGNRTNVSGSLISAGMVGRGQGTWRAGSACMSARCRTTPSMRTRCTTWAWPSGRPATPSVPCSCEFLQLLPPLPLPRSPRAYISHPTRCRAVPHCFFLRGIALVLMASPPHAAASAASGANRQCTVCGQVALTGSEMTRNLTRNAGNAVNK